MRLITERDYRRECLYASPETITACPGRLMDIGLQGSSLKMPVFIGLQADNLLHYNHEIGQLSCKDCAKCRQEPAAQKCATGRNQRTREVQASETDRKIHNQAARSPVTNKYFQKTRRCGEAQFSELFDSLQLGTSSRRSGRRFRISCLIDMRLRSIHSPGGKLGISLERHSSTIFLGIDSHNITDRN